MLMVFWMTPSFMVAQSGQGSASSAPPNPGGSAQTGSANQTGSNPPSVPTQGSNPTPGNQSQTASPSQSENQNASNPSRTQPLVGAQSFGLGTAGTSHDYVIPSFDYSGSIDTNPGYAGGGQQAMLESTYLGDVTLQHLTPRSQLNLSEAVGAGFYNRPLVTPGQPQGISNAEFDSLDLQESVLGRHWQFLLGDEGEYLPESSQSFTGFGGLQSYNSGLGSSALSTGGAISSSLSPDQSILSAPARRLANVGVSEFTLNVGPRTSFALTGDYGALNFLDPGFIDDDYYSLIANGTRAFGPHHSIGLTYVHTLMHFHSPHEDNLNRGFMFSYGYRNLSKFSLEISAGSLLDIFALPSGGTTSRAFLTTLDTLEYRWRTTSLEMGFSRRITGGAGILVGAESDDAYFRLGRALTRTTHLSLDLSHLYNQSLAQTTTAVRRAKAEGWTGGIRLSREMNEHMSLYFSYDVQRQTANQGLCIQNLCGQTFLRQVGRVGINLHTRPRGAR